MGPMAPIAIIIFVVFMLLIAEVAFFQRLFTREQSTKITARETNIIQGINKFEMVLRSLEQSFEYSFYQASSEVLKNGGHTDISEVDSLNCIPYLEVYGDYTSPDFIGNAEDLTEKYLREYSYELMDDDISIPEFEVDIIEDSLYTRFSAAPDGEVQLIREGKLEISDDSVISIRDTYFFQIQNFGTKVIEEGYIGEILRSSIDYSDFENRLSEKEAEIESDENLPLYPIELSLTSDNLISNHTHFVARVLVEISNQREFPVYNYRTNSNEMEPMELKYYIVVSKVPENEVGVPKDQC